MRTNPQVHLLPERVLMVVYCAGAVLLGKGQLNRSGPQRARSGAVRFTG